MFMDESSLSGDKEEEKEEDCGLFTPATCTLAKNVEAH
jgi:hypothetical protein